MAFKMRGHTLPGINKKAGENMPDGRSKSAAFQYKEAVDSAFEKKGCKKNKRSSYKMLNIRNKSNKPCSGCKSICPSCRGKK